MDFSHQKPKRGRRLVGCLLASVLVGAISPPLQANGAPEDTLKAALTLNFARYTEWPESTLAVSPEWLRVCILSEHSLEPAFNAIQGRRAGQRRIRVKTLRHADPDDACDLVYVDSRDRRRLSQLFSAIEHKPVLTIGEMPDFIERGGIINLYRENQKIRFEINLKAARRRHLSISARLLQLARIVE